MLPRIKICCISSIEEAQLAIRAGAAALGLVSEMPSGPGVISEAQIAEIVATVPPPIGTFLLTSRTSASDIIGQHTVCRTNTLQLCDEPDPGTYAALRTALPGVSLVQVLHINGEASIEEARRVAPHVDALLLDSGKPLAAVKTLGGTGQIHDWRISAKIVELSLAPVFLAGGLTAANVGEAIRVVRPFGIDLCSDVRTNGALDVVKLRHFMDSVAATE